MIYVIIILDRRSVFALFSSIVQMVCGADVPSVGFNACAINNLLTLRGILGVPGPIIKVSIVRHARCQDPNIFN